MKLIYLLFWLWILVMNTTTNYYNILIIKKLIKTNNITFYLIQNWKQIIPEIKNKIESAHHQVNVPWILKSHPSHHTLPDTKLTRGQKRPPFKVTDNINIETRDNIQHDCNIIHFPFRFFLSDVAKTLPPVYTHVGVSPGCHFKVFKSWFQSGHCQRSSW